MNSIIRSLASLELVTSKGHRGRAFVSNGALERLSIASLSVQLENSFADAEDVARQKLIGRAVATLPSLAVDIYPGEATPAEWHAYVLAPTICTDPLFACVLATTSVVHELLTTSPVVLETSTFQVVGDCPTHAAVVAGLESWMDRLWPDLEPPSIRVRQWPEMTPGEAFDLSSLPLSPKPMTGAPPELAQDRWSR